jgi:hypothetical protein
LNFWCSVVKVLKLNIINMTDRELIAIIQKANKPSDLFTGDDWKKLYRDYCKLIHPDYHPDSLAADAIKMTTLSGWRFLCHNPIPLRLAQYFL